MPRRLSSHAPPPRRRGARRRPRARPGAPAGAGPPPAAAAQGQEHRHQAHRVDDDQEREERFQGQGRQRAPSGNQQHFARRPRPSRRGGPPRPRPAGTWRRCAGGDGLPRSRPARRRSGREGSPGPGRNGRGWAGQEQGTLEASSPGLTAGTPPLDWPNSTSIPAAPGWTGCGRRCPCPPSRTRRSRAAVREAPRLLLEVGLVVADHLVGPGLPGQGGLLLGGDGGRTRAPRRFAICTSRSPTPPAAAWTRHVSPASSGYVVWLR